MVPTFVVMTTDITPFRIDISQADLDDLRNRLAAARWPDELPGVGRGRGIPLDELRDLAEYWRTGYDWRAAEARLNAYPQFVTEIDGQRIHFLHVRSGQPDALTLVLTHGFPSSVAEFEGLLDGLTQPVEGPAFDVVVPSLPGYAFSTPLASTGWAMGRTARAWVELMRRLGGSSGTASTAATSAAGCPARWPRSTRSTWSVSTSCPTRSLPLTLRPSSPAWPTGSTTTTRSTG